MDTLNRLVVIFLETAELRAKNREDIKMSFWKENIDRILEFNEQRILTNTGKISNAAMEEKIKEIYTLFDENRKKYDAQNADYQDDIELDDLFKQVKK